MLELPSKLSDVISRHLKTDEKVVFFRKKGFFSKTYHILTNQRFLVVQKNALVSEQSFLQDGEENIFISGKHELLTNRRLIALQPDEKGFYQVAIELTYLEPGEKYLSYNLNALHFGGAIPPELGSSFLDATFMVLTDRSLKSFYGYRNNFKQIDNLPISDIVSVNLARVRVLSNRDCCILLRMRTSDEPRIFRHFMTNDRESVERFPKKISEAARVPFAMPFINAREESKVFVEFYTKTDLKWPLKCAHCMNETHDLKYRTLKIEKVKNDPPHNVVGPKSVQYEVQYCQSCFGKKAVKSNNFNGVNAVVEFRNESYAEEFIKINS